MNYGAGSSSGGAGFQQPKLFSSALGQDDNLREERERFADAAKFSSARSDSRFCVAQAKSANLQPVTLIQHFWFGDVAHSLTLFAPVSSITGFIVTLLRP
jgi:hypothetical protein